METVNTLTTVSFQQIITWVVPFLIMYNAWLHRLVLKIQVDIAVNTAKDEEIIKQFGEVKDDIKEMKRDFNKFLMDNNKK